MTPRLQLLLSVLAALLVASAAAWGYLTFRGDTDTDSDEEPIQAPQWVSRQHGEVVVTLDPAAQRRAGIQTVRLKSGSWVDRLEDYGTVLDPQPLVSLSHQYAIARAQLESARARLEASHLAYERVSKLFHDHQNMSQAQLQAAEAAYHMDSASLDAAQSQVDLMADTAQGTWGDVLGQAALKATPLLAHFISHQELLVQVSLHDDEMYMNPRSPHDPPDFIQKSDGAHVPLRYLSTGLRSNPTIQGVTLFFAAPGSSGLLPGMNVLALLNGGRSQAGVMVPPSAIVWSQGSAWAYVRSGASQFVRHRVPTDGPTMPQGYVVPDLPDGTEVVVQGAQMLLSEEHRPEARVSD